MAEIPPWGRSHRRIEREAARELAKELMKNPQKLRTRTFSGPIAFGCGCAMVAPLLALPFQSRLRAVLGAAVFFGFGIYPALYASQFLLKPFRGNLLARGSSILALVLLVLSGSYLAWPPVRRHTLTKAE